MKLVLFLFVVCSCSALQAQYSTYITVDPDGTGDFKSIQSAINATKAFPDKEITIYIKNGVYNEKVTVYAWNTNLSILGESRDSTIIRWDDYFDKINLGRNSTFHTYTVKVDANDVLLKNLTIENTAGRVGQAVALHLEGDRIVVEDCNIKGNQDTAYLAGEGNRQFLRNCFVEGTTDFIFGGATAVFSECTIHSKSNSYITAASTPKESAYGFVLINCKLTAEPEVTKVFLGRPWRPYAQTVFINCQMGGHILPVGWNNWGSEEKEQTVFYAEFASEGKGADPLNRAGWSRQLNAEEASEYHLEQIFEGWEPE